MRSILVGLTTHKMEFPLNAFEIREIVEESLLDVLESPYGPMELLNGLDIFLTGQTIGNLFQMYFIERLCRMYPGIWREGRQKDEMDVVCIPKPEYSFELKTSSSKSGIYGNRSYTKKGLMTHKDRGGWLLAVNYKRPVPNNPSWKIYKIRFGRVDHADWNGQRSNTGQASSVSPIAKRRLYRI